MSHWDPIAAPNQLMEPDIAVDFSEGVEPPNDLTLSLLKDLGWFSDSDGVPEGIDQCPGSDRRTTLFIQDCDTNVPNTTSSTGCRVSDYFRACEGLGAGSRELAACLVSASKPLTRSGMVAPRQLSAILACTRSPLPWDLVILHIPLEISKPKIFEPILPQTTRTTNERH